jgi:hypothetical protein
MKSKEFSKKLKLSKKTIAHLDNGEMKIVQGGVGTEQGPKCHSFVKTECCHPTALYTNCPQCP